MYLGGMGWNRGWIGLALALLACGGGEENGVEPYDLETPRLDFPVGQRRAVLRELTQEYRSGVRTLFTLGVHTIVKDTVVDGRSGLIVAVEEFQLDEDSVRIFQGRDMLLQDDREVTLYRFRRDSSSPAGMVFGLLKRSEYDTAAYDTAVYADRMAVLRHPLATGAAWRIRPESDPNGNFSLEREYLGLDTLEFDGRKLQCARFVLHSFVELHSWVSRVGLLKAEIDHGKYAEFDSLGNFVDSASSRERFELLALDPTDAELDSMKALYRGRYR